MLKALLKNLRIKLRPYYVVAKRDLKNMFTMCKRCGTMGAYACSIAACIPLCEACQREESISLKEYLRRQEWEDLRVARIN
jgi:hypothetical protein